MKQQNINEEFIENVIPIASITTKDKYYLNTIYTMDDTETIIPERYILRNVKTDEIKEITKEDLINFEIISDDDIKDNTGHGITITDNVSNINTELSSFSDAFLKTNKSNALNTMVGGDHYKKGKIQPIEYIFANNLGYIEGCVVKYITRYEHKNGKEDLEKIKHYIDLLIELKYKNNV